MLLKLTPAQVADLSKTDLSTHIAYDLKLKEHFIQVDKIAKIVFWDWRSQIPFQDLEVAKKELFEWTGVPVELFFYGLFSYDDDYIAMVSILDLTDEQVEKTWKYLYEKGDD